jgi:hypothetical protein
LLAVFSVQVDPVMCLKQGGLLLHNVITHKINAEIFTLFDGLESLTAMTV